MNPATDWLSLATRMIREHAAQTHPEPKPVPKPCVYCDGTGWTVECTCYQPYTDWCNCGPSDCPHCDGTGIEAPAE